MPSRITPLSKVTASFGPPRRWSRKQAVRSLVFSLRRKLSMPTVRKGIIRLTCAFVTGTGLRSARVIWQVCISVWVSA